MPDTLSQRLIQRGSPFELQPAGSDGVPLSVFRHAPPCLAGIYARAGSSASRPFLVGPNRTLSYGEVLAEATALARLLRARHGADCGQRIGIVMPNCPQWLVAFMAVTWIGAVAVLVEPEAEPERILTALAAAECTVVIVHESIAAALADGAERRHTVIASELSGSPGELRFRGVESAAHAGDFPVPTLDPDQEALIAFTSGSTGRPKGVISSHRAVITGMMNMLLGSALASLRNRSARPGGTRPQKSPSSLLLAPFTHVGGYSHLLLMLWVAGRVALLPSWRPDAALALIKREQLATIAGADPDRLRELLRTPAAQADLGSLTGIGIHGAAASPALLRELQERLPDAAPLTGYGMTETNGSICIAAGGEVFERPECSGPFVPSVQARIVDEDGSEVAHGARGEIWVRGAMLMSGYCTARDNRTPDAAPALRDGWYRTEDFGRLDTDGGLILLERRQNILDVRGKQVSCAALERMARDCAEVEEAVALAVGDGDRARLVLAIVPRDGVIGRQQQIIERLSGSDLAVGREVDIVTLDSVPRTRSGKIDRHTLRRRLEE